MQVCYSIKLNEKELEEASRNLCRVRGQDPDAMVGHGARPNADGTIPLILLSSPAWKIAAIEVENFTAVWNSILSLSPIHNG